MLPPPSPALALRRRLTRIPPDHPAIQATITAWTRLYRTPDDPDAIAGAERLLGLIDATR